MALALKAAGVIFRTVGTEWVDFKVSGGDCIRQKLPMRVKQFVENFDRGQPVEPLRFILEVPQECLRQIPSSDQALAPRRSTPDRKY